MNKENNEQAIALYTTYSQEFEWQSQERGGKYRSPLWLKMNITVALLNYAYKKYFNIDVNPDELNVHNYSHVKEYGGLYFAYALGDKSVMIAIGDKPLEIAAASRPLDNEWRPDGSLLHPNELEQYEQSGFSPDELTAIWSRKIAYRRLHGIEQPKDADPFDNSFQKDIDGTLGEYSMHRFDHDRLVHHIAVTGKAEFAEVNIEEFFKLD